MKINTISKILIVFLLTNLAVSCVKDTDYELPDTTIPVPKFDGTVKSIEDVVAVTTDEVTEYQDNDALEGYVISSDEGGNFYKKIYVENADKTHGFAIALDKGGLYSEFPFGAKVQVRLKGLSVQLVDGKLEVGYKTYTSKSGRVSVGTMPPVIYKEHFYNLQEKLKDKEALAKTSTSVKDLKNRDNVNLLLTFENVYFDRSAVGKTFHVKENDNYSGTNYNLIDSEGNKVAFRTSKYAKFKDEKVPDGLLNVTGILTTYNGSYQFLVSNADDITVVGETPNGGGVSGEVLNLPIEEKFEKGIPDTWQNIDAKGGRTWQGKDFKGDKYVQMSAFSGGKILDVETWLITPKINLGDTEDNTLKVKFADAHQNGNPLRIVYSSDYNGTDIKSATWTEIGTEAVKALINNSGSYDNKYEESQPIKIPAKGEVYIAFVYESKGKVSTTIQLKSVSITKGDGSGTTPPPTSGDVKSIADVRAMFKGSKITIDEEITIEGIVISDRNTGNTNSKNLVVQGENTGITLRFNADHDVDLGQKVKISIKGAELGEYKGLLQLNKLETSAILSKENGTLPTPKVVTIKDILGGKYQSEWVKIEGVQFKETDKTYSGNNLITNCTDELTVFVNGKATFSSEQVNSKRGRITGYVSKFDNPQLIINNTSDVKFTEDYKDCSGGGTTTGNTKSIADVRAMFKGSKITIDEEITIEGIVISDRTTGNIHGNNVVIQDNTAGIALRFKGKHDLNLGQKIKVSVKGAELSEYGGLLQINKLESSAVLSKEEGTLPATKVVTISEVLSGKYQSQLVKIVDVQFKDAAKEYLGANIITNCTDEITTYVRKEATFAGDKVNDKRGSITGYISVNKNIPQLIINDTSDVKFTEDYKDCSGGTTPPSGGTTKTYKFDFEDIEDVSNSYSTEGTLTSSEGNAILAFKGRTDMDKYAINGKGIMMKNKEFVKITFSKGVKTLKFKYRGAYSNKSKRKVIVFEGDENSDKMLKEEEFAYDVTSETFSLDLDKKDSYTITIKGGTSKQIVIDDIEWTN